MLHKTTYDVESRNSLKVTLRLLLVRHGLSSFNLEQRIQGRNDLSTLTKKGEIQAVKTGKILSELKIDALYSSPLQRAALTTQKILESFSQKITPVFDEGLLEIDLELWSGLKSNEVKKVFPNEYQTWKENPEEFVLSKKDGRKYKPIKELMDQANEFLTKIINNHPLNEDSTVLLVGHNAILKCLIMCLLNQPIDNINRLKVNNTSLSVMNINPSDIKGYEVQIECLNNTTHLEVPIPEKGNGSRLILVRHGETNWNKEGRFQGQIDIPLNINGIKQAQAAGEFLRDTMIDKAFSSCLKRPKETAEAILKHHPEIIIQDREELIEIGHGLWEGKLESEINSNWPSLLNKWKESPQKVQMPEGENINQVWDRSVECWKEISKSLQPSETALVVAHDAVNKTILCNLLGLSSKDIWSVKQGNGAVTIIDLPLETNLPAIVTSLNLTSHLGGVLDNTATGAL